MTRVEENKMILEEMTERAERLLPMTTHEGMVTFQLGTIATMLTDISRSLAVIADGVKKEDGNE